MSGWPHFIAKIVKELIGFSKELLRLDTQREKELYQSL